MTLLVLESSAWREFRGVLGSAGNRNGTAHFAKIADPTGELHDCFVKLLPTNEPALLCEAIGWLLAKAAGVPCPHFAAIVLVPVEELRKHMELPAEMTSSEVCPAWCCDLVPGKTVRQVHKWAYFLAVRKCLRSKDVRKIAAFDYWSDLRDRNFGNVIRASSGGYVAIDHETILHDLLWKLANRRFEPRSLLLEAQKALTTGELKDFHLDMAIASESHSDAISAAEPEIKRVFELIYPQLAELLLPQVTRMLSQRGQRGWLASEVGVIA